ncbi:MAG: hypothetical protein E6Q99_01690 [Elusimicrobia bacterium]|nr:MAG: hypothetical protein EYC71_00975 [Gammaproteobacteria bacterium]TXH28938.1 MAG: hypothetical protein E6Q99_01690 [Elusimicrobiota bacterium]
MTSAFRLTRKNPVLAPVFLIPTAENRNRGQRFAYLARKASGSLAVSLFLSSILTHKAHKMAFIRQLK